MPPWGRLYSAEWRFRRSKVLPQRSFRFGHQRLQRGREPIDGIDGVRGRSQTIICARERAVSPRRLPPDL